MESKNINRQVFNGTEIGKQVICVTSTNDIYLVPEFFNLEKYGLNISYPESRNWLFPLIKNNGDKEYDLISLKNYRKWMNESLNIVSSNNENYNGNRINTEKLSNFRKNMEIILESLTPKTNISSTPVFTNNKTDFYLSSTINFEPTESGDELALIKKKEDFLINQKIELEEFLKNYEIELDQIRKSNNNFDLTMEMLSNQTFNIIEENYLETYNNNQITFIVSKQNKITFLIPEIMKVLENKPNTRLDGDIIIDGNRIYTTVSELELKDWLSNGDAEARKFRDWLFDDVIPNIKLGVL